MNYKPALYNDVLIAEIENDAHYFVYSPGYDVRFKVNAQTAYLLKLMDGEKTLSELTVLTGNHFNRNISTEALDYFIKHTLEPYGILKTTRKVLKKERAPYLRLRMTLIPQQIVSKITHYFQLLIFPGIWYCITFLLVALSILYASAISFSDLPHFITAAHVLWYIPLALCSRLVHELGHASACERFGIKAGSIGFGFYLFMPVFYADVSNAWRLSSRKRIIINIAGMYFQLLLSCMLVVIYVITANKWMLYASLINIVSFLPNLNPFVRYDGYWILSDLLGMNNTIQKAEKSYKLTHAWMHNKKKNEFPLKTNTDKFLLSYFLLNKMMVAVFLLVFVMFNGHAVLYFPYKLLHVILSLAMKHEVLSFQFIKLFILENWVSVMFYFLLFKSVKSILTTAKIKTLRV